MDFGIFFLFIGGVLVLIIGSVNVAHQFFNGGTDRKPALVALALFAAVMVCFAHFLYQTFGLDENLAIAAGEGDTAQVKLLLSRGADPNAQFEGQTAVEKAGEYGHTEIVTLLQRAGAR